MDLPLKVDITYDRNFRGEEVSISYRLTGPEEAVEAKVAQLEREWPPPGYGTSVTYRGWEGPSRVIVVSRFLSCD